jgi:hypothetical protein
MWNENTVAFATDEVWLEKIYRNSKKQCSVQRL